MFSTLATKSQILYLLTKNIPKRNFVKALKDIKPEAYLKTTTIPNPSKATEEFADVEDFNKKSYKRGLLEEEKPVPTSPVLGPMRVENLKVSDKKYRWCSCGMSQTQPFCDNSHSGTHFKPLRFTVEETTKAMDLCGCKLTKNAPFCDGETCVHLKNNQGAK